MPPESAPPVVARYQANPVGRDFVIGDIHGCFEGVGAILSDIAFNPESDRLFCVGDLIDRGDLSHRVLDFVQQPWVHVVRGNHEDALVQLHGADPFDEGAVVMHAIRNGCNWWLDLSDEEREAHLKVFAAMPIAIQIESPKGLIGIVHAEVPGGMAWGEFTQQLEAGDERARRIALWGRRRIKAGDTSEVPGLRRLFVGHSICDQPTRLGNVHYIDTGGFLGILEERLTVVDLGVTTSVLKEHFVEPQEADLSAFAPG